MHYGRKDHSKYCRCDACESEYQRRRQHIRNGNFADPPDKYISLDEAAKRLGVTRNALNVRIHRNNWLSEWRIRRGLRGQYFVHEDHLWEDE